MIDVTRFKDAMNKLQEKFKEEKSVLEKNNVDLEVVRPDAKDNIGTETIDDIISRTNDKIFKLLVMGRFSSGKSSFINVLLGEKLLPEKALPTTALITEIYYGEKKKVIMYPKPGQWKGGDEPFEIKAELSEIKKYSTIDSSAGLNTKEANRVQSVFKKMVVFWPLDILKEGVVIIDSPGIDDPYSNDYIVEQYVPQADAILFCINGTNPYNALDRRTLESLNSRGFSNPIIVTTYFDHIQQDGNESEKAFLDDTQKLYSSHTTKDCCHYVNSRQGILAKQNSDHKAYVESGYSELESFLSRYLTENRGKEKLTNILTSAKMYNQNQITRINGMIGTLDIPMDEFNRKIERANDDLKKAEKQGDLIKREYNLEVIKVKEEAHSLVPALYDSLCNELDLDDFEPDTNFSIWSPKASSTQIAEECAKEVELRINLISSKWYENTLSPFISKSFADIAKKLDAQIQIFIDDISSAEMSVNVGAGKAKTENGKVTNVALLAYALATGDWFDALSFGMFGFKGMLRMMLCEFVAGFIFALLFPGSLPALIILGLASIIAGAGWNMSLAADTIKKNTIKETKKALKGKRAEIIAQAQQKCDELFDKMEKSMDAAIQADIQTVKDTIAIIQRERDENAERVEQRKAELAEVVSFLEEANNTVIADIKKEFGIANIA